MEEKTIGLVQLLCTLVGGMFALYLFWQSNREKRQSFVVTLYDKLYNDPEIRSLLYALDKEQDLAEINPRKKLEQAADKTLRFLDFVGGLIKNGSLRRHDIYSFEYELQLLKHQALQQYQRHVMAHHVQLNNLEYVTGEKQPSRWVQLVAWL